MNRQPYATPPRWWEPKLSPKWVKMTRRYRWRKLRRGQRLVNVDAQGLEHVQDAVRAGNGVLITPNHSAHYDSEALYVAMDQISQPVYFMTAWQVFGMSKRWERFLMQRLGCFSIDRESNDRQAMKQAIRVLQSEPYPLVIFPEGDIYHVTDRVTPFREGAAAIALSASKRSQRPLVVIPCGIKFWYVDDPTQELTRLIARLEDRVLIRPLPNLPLTERVYRLAEGVLALKELDYLGSTCSGALRDRITDLSEAILENFEQRYDARPNGDSVPERVKMLRQCIIRQSEQLRTDVPKRHGIIKKLREKIGTRDAHFDQLERDMDDLFFVMQLYSYPGDYLGEQTTIERLAETLDKFEEDILRVDLPSVRGRRRVTIRFGEPLEVSHGSDRRQQIAHLTAEMQRAVQKILDDINAGH